MLFCKQYKDQEMWNIRPTFTVEDSSKEGPGHSTDWQLKVVYPQRGFVTQHGHGPLFLEDYSIFFPSGEKPSYTNYALARKESCFVSEEKAIRAYVRLSEKILAATEEQVSELLKKQKALQQNFAKAEQALKEFKAQKLLAKVAS